jgi:hypothetical protein
MPVSELAVMVQGLPSTSKRRASVKKRMTRGSWQRLCQLAQSFKQVLRCAGIFRSSRCVRRSVLLTTITECRLMLCASSAAPLFVRVANVFAGLPLLPNERVIKTSIVGDL